MANIIPIKVTRTLGDTTGLSEYNPGDEVDPTFLPSISNLGGVPSSHLTDSNPHNITPALINAVGTVDFNNHVNDLTVHRTINDGGVSPTDLWSGSFITTLLANKSNVGHNHDNLYYTEAEVDALITANLGYVKVDSPDTPDFLENKIVDGQGNTVGVNTGASKTLQINNEVYIATINGQPHPVFVDNTRGKVLSTSISEYMYAENIVSTNEWMKIGRATDSLSGHISPFDGTIVGVTAHCENATNANYFRLYVNGIEVNSNLFTFTVGPDSIVNIQSLDININAGDKIRLRAGNVGTVNDTVIKLQIRWRA